MLLRPNTQINRADRYDELERLFEHWLPRGGEASLESYREWKRSSYITLPYAGGWLQQPVWVHDDFTMWQLYEEYLDLTARLPVRPVNAQKAPYGD